MSNGYAENRSNGDTPRRKRRPFFRRKGQRESAARQYLVSHLPAVPTIAEVARKLGITSGALRNYPDFMRDYKAAVRKHGRTSRAGESEAVAWQRQFAKEHHKLPTFRELWTAGYTSAHSRAVWRRFALERNHLERRYGPNLAGRLRAQNVERKAIDWQQEFAEQHHRLPTFAELSAVGYGFTRHHEHCPKFAVERKTLQERYGRNYGGRPDAGRLEGKAIAWQQRFAERYMRPPMLKELQGAGFLSAGEDRRWLKFAAARKALERRFGPNRGGNHRAEEAEEKVVLWQQEFAERHQRLPTFRELSAVGYDWARNRKSCPKFAAERKALEKRYGRNTGRPDAGVLEGKAIAWQQQFAERYKRPPTLRELQEAGYASAGHAAYQSWPRFATERKVLEKRYGRNAPFRIAQGAALSGETANAAPPAAGNGHAIAETPAPPAASNGHGIAEAPAPPAADSGHAPTAPTLSHRQSYLLQALFELGAFSAPLRVTTREVAKKTEGSLDASVFRKPIGHLKRLRLVEVKEGRGGGCWLSEGGKAVVTGCLKSRLKSDLRAKL